MSKSATNVPDISIRLEGLMGLFFDKDGGGQRVLCKVGVVKDARDHKVSLAVTKNGQNIPVQVGSRLELDVQNTGSPGLSFAPGNVDRHGKQDSESYKWILDFEGGELYNFEIGADPTMFVPILQLNKGELYTIKVSKNKLISFDEKIPPGAQVIGRVATEVGVRIFLDTPRSRATFKNDGSLVFEASPGDKYEIVLRNTRPHEHGDRHPDDANLFYPAVGHKIPAGGKKHFTSTPLNRISPEASCLIPDFSRSNI